MHCLTFGLRERAASPLAKHTQQTRFHWPLAPRLFLSAEFRSRIRDRFVTVFIALQLRHFSVAAAPAPAVRSAMASIWPPGQSTRVRVYHVFRAAPAHPAPQWQKETVSSLAFTFLGTNSASDSDFESDFASGSDLDS